MTTPQSSDERVAQLDAERASSRAAQDAQIAALPVERRKALQDKALAQLRTELAKLGTAALVRLTPDSPAVKARMRLLLVADTTTDRSAS